MDMAMCMYMKRIIQLNSFLKIEPGHSPAFLTLSLLSVPSGYFSSLFFEINNSTVCQYCMAVVSKICGQYTVLDLQEI